MTIAALYVQTGGCYVDLPDVDPWDEARDARLYAGPHPVVAHPPCARWGAFWYGGMQWISDGNTPMTLGDDDGCFEAALFAVRRFGGVLEHPANSHAWDHFALNHPPNAGGWTRADFEGGWTCRVEQGHYGHKARKATWLYAHGFEPPSLTWGAYIPDLSRWSDRGRARILKEGVVGVLSRKERAATPLPFRDLLLDMARSVTPR